MNVKAAGALFAVAVAVFALLGTLPSGSAQDAARSFKLLNQDDGTFSYTLNVVVSPSLNEYYVGLSHRAYVNGDFPKFITPDAVQPIADALRQIYPDDEDFANGVLTLVHQIPYNETIPEFYPVETLVKNLGDCDMFSVLAASIMKAGGLEVALLHYTAEEHMNVGVHLAEEPEDARSDVYSVKNRNFIYYMAECTGVNWQDGWRVGECPSDLQGASATIILLYNVEEEAPGQVSASFNVLESTSLEFSVSPLFSLEGGAVTLEGQLSPALSNENITLYWSEGGSGWEVVDTTKTLSNGEFRYVWQPDRAGGVNLRASWMGNDQFAGTTSQAQAMIIMPYYLLALIAAAVAAVTVCAVVFVSKRKSRRNKLPPPPPEAAYTYEI